MVTLKEKIDIPVPFKKLCAWVDNFEEEFVKWSPYHLECELLDGNIDVGSKVRFYEIVMGMDYDVTGTIIDSIRDDNHFRFTFLSNAKTAKITFEGFATKEGCLFEHTEEFGVRTPIIGAVINFLVFKVFFRKKANWKLIRDDMILDNKYLYDILTEEKYPKRLSREELKIS